MLNDKTRARGGVPRNWLTDGRTREGKKRRGLVRAYGTAIRTPSLIDGRSAAGRVVIATRNALIEHCGGEDRLTAPQRALIERCAMLQLRLTVLDQRIVDGTFSEYDAKTYLAFCNSLTRSLVALGVHSPAPSGPNLNDVLSTIAARRSEGSAA